MSCVRPTGWRTSGHLAWQKLQHWTLHANCSTKFCHACHACRHHWHLLLFTIFTDLELAWGSQISTKQNLLASFSHTLFSCSGLNLIWCWSSKIWTSWSYFWVRLNEWNKGNNCCFNNWRKENLNVGMHSGICNSIWFKHSLMIDDIQLYIVILALLTLTLIPGHRSAWKQIPLWQLSHKGLDWFGWNLVYCWDLLV